MFFQVSQELGWGKHPHLAIGFKIKKVLVARNDYVGLASLSAADKFVVRRVIVNDPFPFFAVTVLQLGNISRPPSR